MEEGDEVTGDYLVIGTGASPIRPDIEGMDLDNVFDLRTLTDAKAIKSAVKDKRVVIIGSSFIGLEAAASLSQGGNALSITVIGRDETLLNNIVSKQVGQAIQNLHEDNGVTFRLNSKVKKLQGNQGSVAGVILESNECVDADVVIAGTGVAPNIEVIVSNQKEEDTGVHVSATLSLNDASFAGGDVGEAQTIFGHQRIEHWRVALQHGMIIAESILKQVNNNQTVRPFNKRVPFFWTQQYGKSLRYVGFAETPKYAILRGNPNEINYIEFYFDSDEDTACVAAASGLGFDKELIAVSELIRLHNAPTRIQIKDGLDIIKHLSQIT